MNRILLVEDEFLVRELAVEDLTDSGFDVTPVGTGDEALAILREGRRFDLLLTDLRLPGSSDGRDVAREGKRLIEGLRVIYATGFSDSSIAAGEGEAVLQKPFTKAELLDSLRKVGLQVEG